MPKKVRVGVLALQGDFREHVESLQRAGVEAVEVRLPAQLKGLDGLIIPGGESTTILRLIDIFKFREPIIDFIRGGGPLWGTCAGMIVVAQKATDLTRPTLGLINVSVCRNAFGRQVDSFEEDLTIAAGDFAQREKPFHAVFIRAPVIEETGAAVEVLARLPNGAPVAARRGKVLVTAFHPELTPDLRFHEFFLGFSAMKE
ncbi:MAG: pyridoxal 5'-phosphate synthase glutaminase subunit PdxT [Chloroflexi bacterium]|nr:pyridoxal 5'-phosphate synthase glutaminase subunit PdxT [Chloroflexota bacterium]